MEMICKNPMNFGLYDHFNPSTGDVVENIVTAPKVLPDGTCSHWDAAPNHWPEQGE